MVTVVIKNARVVSPREIRQCCIAIEGEKIHSLGSESSMPSAETVIDAAGNYVIPGFIDPHVHIGLLGPPDPVDKLKRTWTAQTRGAAHGGLTTILPMLGWPGGYNQVMDRIIPWGEKNSYCDFGFTAVIGESGIAEMPGYFKRGIAGFKSFLSAWSGEEGKVYSVESVDAGQYYQTLEMVASLGPPAISMVHAEDSELYNYFTKKAFEAGKGGLAGWDEARPSLCEYTRVEMACAMAVHAKAPVYIVHATCKEVVDIIEKYRAMGHQVEGEVTVHGLNISIEDWEEVGVWGKVNPPQRTAEHQDRYWEGLRSGALQHVGTDSNDINRAEKEQGEGKYGSIYKAFLGTSNAVEHFLPAMVTEGVKKGRLSIQKMVEVCSENNAKQFGLYPRKGVLAEGSDADLNIIDLDIEKTVDEKFFHTNALDINVFWGRKLVKPRLTMIRGQVVVKDDKTVAKPGVGKYIPAQT